ncbi:MAG: L,D-transpeptidase [Caldilineaceae bacterium]|nr:L,D-transpeptidase [Caldilineaceae bacterium]
MSKQSNPGSGFRLSRREVLGGIAGTVVFAAGLEAVAKQVVKEIHELQPGEYTWHPERQPDGPVAVVVSIPEQRVHVYRNGVRIAASTCSTGKPGHSTPTGVFVVLQKDKHHHSSTYNNAPMPNMNRLTWSGIALHAGKLPGYPASHGCVRLPLEFSAKLFGVTHLGTPVIISGAHSDPWELIHPGMVLGAYAENEFETVVSGLEDKKHPSDWQESETYPVVSVIASSTDRKIEMIENGEIVSSGKLRGEPDGGFGGHVFVLKGAHAEARGMHWLAITHGDEPDNVTSDNDVLGRLRADAQFVQAMQEKLHPGMVLITTDLPLDPDRRSGKDFVIATQDEA